jgi:hypothetical protein
MSANATSGKSAVTCTAAPQPVVAPRERVGPLLGGEELRRERVQHLKHGRRPEDPHDQRSGQGDLSMERVGPEDPRRRREEDHHRASSSTDPIQHPPR